MKWYHFRTQKGACIAVKGTNQAVALEEACERMNCSENDIDRSGCYVEEFYNDAATRTLDGLPMRAAR